MVAVPYAEGLLISYTAKHHLSKREKVEWYFCFCLKKQIHTITVQTNARSGMYKHIFNSNASISGHAAPHSLVFE